MSVEVRAVRSGGGRGLGVGALHPIRAMSSCRPKAELSRVTGFRLPKLFWPISRRLGTGMLVVACVAALSGCGSDDKPATSGDESSLQGWAQGLCTQVAEWQASTKSTGAAMANSKDDFAEAEAAVTSADDALVEGLEGLAAPPAPASTEAKDAIAGLSTELEQKAGDIQEALLEEPRTESELVTATARVRALISEMNSDISKTVTELKALPDEEGWKEAFEQVPSCRGVATG